MINKLLEERKLPELLKMKNGEPVSVENWEKRREELVDVLAENVYGRMPQYEGETTWHIHNDGGVPAAATVEAFTYKVDITFPTPYKESFTFPVSLSIPSDASPENKKPAFVYISFGHLRYYPIEEVMEKDVIVAEFIMDHVTLDKDDDWESGMASHYFPDGKRTPNGFGKIGMWAFAASRVLDFLLALGYVDSKRVGVIGHSRLGKTALWAGANDTRFTHVISNESGCGGASLTRGKEGEDFPALYNRFPYWFCENMGEVSASVEVSENSDFDQHFLLAASAPRKVNVASARKDVWCDPDSEYLCCVAASAAWELNGKAGFVHPDRLPKENEIFAEGNLCYHIRPGIHFLSRHDWMRYCDFIKK